jgi:hypothetical protein
VHWTGGMSSTADGTGSNGPGGNGSRESSDQGSRAGNGLPMGIQLIGPMGSEALLLQVAAQLGY